MPRPTITTGPAIRLGRHPAAPPKEVIAMPHPHPPPRAPPGRAPHVAADPTARVDTVALLDDLTDPAIRLGLRAAAAIQTGSHLDQYRRDPASGDDPHACTYTVWDALGLPRPRSAAEEQALRAELGLDENDPEGGA